MGGGEGEGRGVGEGVEGYTHKAAVCVESSPAWLRGNALALLSWWTLASVVRVGGKSNGCQRSPTLEF